MKRKNDAMWYILYIENYIYFISLTRKNEKYREWILSEKKLEKFKIMQQI